MNAFARALTGTMAVAALALSTGCDKPKDDGGSKPTKPTMPNASSAVPASPIELSDDDVPVEEDFIEEATKEINGDNLNAKLDEIEKEIGE